MNDKIRLGIVSDSACIDTGYGKVSREVFRRLKLTNKFDITQLGFWHNKSDHYDAQWPIHETNKDSRGWSTQADKYGQESFDIYYEKFKPQIVWATGDPWMLKGVSDSKYRNEFRLIYYVPIDFEHVTDIISTMISDPDLVVGYTKYGSKILSNHFGRNISAINPGVDNNVFRPYADRIKWREQTFGMSDDHLLCGFFSRNNNRKNLYALLSALDIVRNKLGNKNIFVYAHCSDRDSGPNLRYMMDSLNLVGGVFTNPAIRMAGKGVSEQDLAVMMNICDICFLPSTREGFGMTGVETMACGRKTYVTKCTGMLDYGINFLEPVTTMMESEPLMSAISYIVDPQQIANIMIDNYENRHKLPGPDIDSYNATKTLSWDNQAAKWFKLISCEAENIFTGDQWTILETV